MLSVRDCRYWKNANFEAFFLLRIASFRKASIPNAIICIIKLILFTERADKMLLGAMHDGLPSGKLPCLMSLAILTAAVFEC